MGRWRNGRRDGLKNHFRKECGFETHPPYENTLAGIFLSAEVSDQNAFDNENCSEMGSFCFHVPYSNILHVLLIFLTYISPIG